MSENKECLFYIDHNPPEYSGTWGGAIHKGACKVNSTDCKDTGGCFIKNLYSKLKAKEQECEELKFENLTLKELIKKEGGINELIGLAYKLQNKLELTKIKRDEYKQALDEIKKIAQQGLEPICYKSNCSRCECYDGDNCKASVTEFLNHFFDDNGDMRENEDFSESLIALVDEERLKCNRAKPISEKILDIINKAKAVNNAK